MTTIQTINSGNIIKVRTNLYTNNVVVLLSSRTPSTRYTIIDVDGNPLFFSPTAPYSLSISPATGTFLDGTTSVQIVNPFDTVTCVQVTPTLWQVIASKGITDTSTPIMQILTTSNATALSNCFFSTLVTSSISSYGLINAASITTQGVLYASISTISTAINTLETTSPYNYISISTMSTVISTSSNAPYYYITSTILAQSSLLLSTTTYNYITASSLQTAIGNMSTIPGIISSIPVSYFTGCTANNYLYNASTLSTTTCLSDFNNGILVSMSNDAGGSGNILCTNSFITNTMYGNAAGITTVSDIRLKRDIEHLVSSLEKLNQLQGVSYKYNGDHTTKIGFIAQDVEKVIPDIVRSDRSQDNILGLRYKGLIAPLIDAITELDSLITELESCAKESI